MTKRCTDSGSPVRGFQTFVSLICTVVVNISVVASSMATPLFRPAAATDTEDSVDPEDV